jgi:CO/xanthine dehydrogenase FAD-binding subunit
MSSIFEYLRPTTLREAWQLASSRPGARFIAGGTDVMVRMREGKVQAPALISLRAIRELAQIAIGPPLVLGAGVRVSDIEANQEIARVLPVLLDAARTLGSVQIRNAATIGGNLCNASPCADLAPPLLVHEARVRLSSATSERELPLEDFFVGPRTSVLLPGEVLREVVVDASPGARAIFFKKGRVQMDIALGSIAVLLETKGRTCVRARVAAGSLGPKPMRLREVEKTLEGATLDDRTIAIARQAAEQEVRPISDVRASLDYRRHLAGALFERGIRALMDGGRA